MKNRQIFSAGRCRASSLIPHPSSLSSSPGYRSTRRLSTGGPRTTGYSSSPGFTLLEVVIALAITSLCLGLLAVSFGAVSRGNSRAQATLELEQTMNESMERLRLLLQSAYLSPYQNTRLNTTFETVNEEKMNQPYNALTFTTLAHSSHQVDAKEADLAEVTLFTKEGPPLETPEGKVEVRRLRIRVGGEINSRFEVEHGLVYTLADHVTLFQLAYLTPEGEWKEEWIPADRNNTLPCAVRIKLGMRAPEIAEKLETLMVPLEMGKKKCRFDDERIFQEEIKK